MKKHTCKTTANKDVIERYCPKIGENVVMLKSLGSDQKLECMSSDHCECRKDKFCGINSSSV